MNRPVIASLVSALAAAACGGDEPEHADGVMDPAAARTSIEQAGEIVASMAAMNGEDVAHGIQVMLSADQGLIGPAGESQRPAGIVFVIPTAPAFPRGGTATCTATSCRFTRYGFAVPYVGFFVDGTITRSGDVSTFDIAYTAVEHFYSMHLMLEGSLTTTATGIDGHLRCHGPGSQDPGLMWDVSIDYRAITLDAQGCPTGGSVHVVTAYHAPADQPDPSPPSFDVEGSVAFGPACDAPS